MVSLFLFPLFVNSQKLVISGDSIDVATHKFDEYPLISKFYVRKPYSQEMVFFKIWNSGDIHLENGYTLKNIMICYDRMEDLLVWVRESDLKMGVVNREIVKGFTINDTLPGLSYYFEKENSIVSWVDDIYFQVMAQGFLTVRSWRKVQKSTSSSDLSFYDRFYLTINGSTKSFSLNRASFLANLGPYKKEMRQIIRKNHLRITDNEADLIKAVNLFNESK